MRIVFLNYSYTKGFDRPEAWVKKIKPYLLKLEALSRGHFTAYVGQIDYTGSYTESGVQYYFSHPRSHRSFFPRHLHKIVKQLQPDMMIVAGFIFPLQVIQLRRTLGKKVKILARHHADSPAGWKRKLLQRFADRYIDAYLFTAFGNAKPWIDTGIIPEHKVREIPEASTSFTRQDKENSRRTTGMNGSLNFLWVGRLNANKDPLTVLTAFEQYFERYPGTKLYMIYQDDDMLPVVQEKIAAGRWLKDRVILVGKIPHDELPAWYSAADYFILASHSEGGSYALTEAMACGCIPIVSRIPASMNAIGDGDAGHYFNPGNAEGLLHELFSLEERREELSSLIQSHFREYLSADAIAKRLQHILHSLHTK